MSGMVLSLVPALLLLGAVLAAGAAGVDRALRTRDAEKLFWVGFTAFLGVLLTTAWVAAAAPAPAAVAGAAVVFGSGAAAWWVAVRHRRRTKRLEQQRQEAEVQGISARHRAVLTRWSAYELDPWLAAAHPGLQDVRTPETRDFIRALKTAEQLRPAVRTPADAAAYGEAVDRLEARLEAAEKAAGGGQAA